jgi:protein subunit release factor B
VAGLTRAPRKSFNEKKRASMTLPSQIFEKLAALGVRASDVEEKFVRGSGPGGQKINKTSSTVWLRHGPTGIEVRCQRERSQSANRELAWAELAEKLAKRKRGAVAAVVNAREEERRRTRQKSRGQKVRMIQTKKHRAKHKAKRGRVSED